MSDYTIIFAKDPVWVQTTRSGFRQQLFVMYHSTSVENVENIIEKGFNVSPMSDHLVLGSGLYVSRDIKKSISYGRVTFKLLVYPGKTKTIIDQADPLRTSWQQEFSSAWLTPDSTVSPAHSLGSREETCVKSSNQVRILGVSRGWEFLAPHLQTKISNVAGSSDGLDRRDNLVLEHMLEDLGIVYSSLVNLNEQRFLEGSRSGKVYLSDYTGSEEQQWSRTWDNCLENKATGLVLTLTAGDRLSLTEVNMQIDKSQKWRMDGKGRFVHKANNFVLLAGQPTGRDGIKLEVKVCRLHSSTKCDFWKFRCMNEIREKDDFVQFTPWRDMISWD